MGNKFDRFQAHLGAILDNELIEAGLRLPSRLKKRSIEKSVIESLLGQLPQSIRVFDAKSGKCLLVNESAAAIAGGTRQQLLKQNFRALNSWRETVLLTAAEDVLRDGVPRTVTVKITSSFGRTVPVSYQLTKIFVKRRAKLLLIGRDLSEEQAVQEEKKRTEEKLFVAQKVESMAVLAGGIAHDFNNILTAIIGNTNLALMKLAPESPAIDNLRRIETAASRAADLARQMLAYSGKGAITKESIDLNRLIEEMLHMLEVTLSKSAFFRLHLYRPLPYVDVDATQIRQILLNLVMNASEAIGDVSGIIAISTGCIRYNQNYNQDVWLHDNLKEGLYVFLEVSDSGCGMAKETMKRIFDPFFTTKVKGRGLGMAAVHGIVKSHGGAIKVYSEPGKGSSFKILLPANTSTSEVVTNMKINWVESDTVLLVDDEETLRATGSEMLRELGLHVVTAGDGKEAVETFERRDDIKLVLMDLTMPHMDGEQAFREMRRLNPGIKVVICSGFNESDVIQRFAGKGLAGFIQKPYTLDRMKEVLESIGL